MCYFLIKVVLNYDGMIGCNVYGNSYECAGAPTRFYLGTLIMAMSLLGLTILIDLYKLIWMYFPSLSPLNAVLNRYIEQRMSHLLSMYSIFWKKLVCSVITHFIF